MLIPKQATKYYINKTNIISCCSSIVTMNICVSHSH